MMIRPARARREGTPPGMPRRFRPNDSGGRATSEYEKRYPEPDCSDEAGSNNGVPVLHSGVARRMLGHTVRANHLEDPFALLIVDPHVSLSTHGLCRGKRRSHAASFEARGATVTRPGRRRSYATEASARVRLGWARDSVRSSHHHHGTASARPDPGRERGKKLTVPATPRCLPARQRGPSQRPHRRSNPGITACRSVCCLFWNDVGSV